MGHQHLSDQQEFGSAPGFWPEHEQRDSAPALCREEALAGNS
jgi:hypothetical protein